QVYICTFPLIIVSHPDCVQILQNLVSSTNQQARAYSTRALFHKIVTVAQLESLITCHQCLKRTYMECEDDLQSQTHQYASSLKSYEKKYAKYAEQLSSLRGKLTGLCDKRKFASISLSLRSVQIPERIVSSPLCVVLAGCRKFLLVAS
ncbi:hypothetical protein AHF37_10599, partial [Paragonimus kellicotti]